MESTHHNNMTGFSPGGPGLKADAGYWGNHFSSPRPILTHEGQGNSVPVTPLGSAVEGVLSSQFCRISNLKFRFIPAKIMWSGFLLRGTFWDVIIAPMILQYQKKIYAFWMKKSLIEYFKTSNLLFSNHFSTTFIGFDFIESPL